MSRLPVIRTVCLPGGLSLGDKQTPSLARDQSLPCKSALNGKGRHASTAGVEILAWLVNDVSAGASHPSGRAEEWEKGVSPTSLGSLNTHRPDTKPSLFGAV